MKCQICEGLQTHVFSKEANVSCGDYFEGKRLFPKNVGDFDFIECAQCGFSHFRDFLPWSDADFKSKIYNSDYHLCDAPFKIERPKRLSLWLKTLAGNASLLDYGGGEGTMCKLLRADGYDAVSYDPYYQDAPFPTRKFDIVTAFEVFEHVPRQRELIQTLARLTKPDGMIIFSTLLKPKNLQGDWWYASPRNGHACFHTQQSLSRLMSLGGFSVVSLSPEIHMASKNQSRLSSALTWKLTSVNASPDYEFQTKWTSLRLKG